MPRLTITESHADEADAIVLVQLAQATRLFYLVHTPTYIYVGVAHRPHNYYSFSWKLEILTRWIRETDNKFGLAYKQSHVGCNSWCNNDYHAWLTALSAQYVL